jgi:hypothetical protein
VTVEFESFGFDPGYEVTLDPEFPGDGNWGCPTFAYGRDGRLRDEFGSRWGTPMVIEVSSVDAHWVGMFAAGGLGGVRGVFACPSPEACCILADGLAYLVDVWAPEAGAVIAHDQVVQVLPVAGARLLLLVRFIDIVAIGQDGVVWATPRLVVDDLRVEMATADSIVCSGDNLGALAPSNSTLRRVSREPGPAWTLSGRRTHWLDDQPGPREAQH